jgi:very-short-patch-repair endonuclease
MVFESFSPLPPTGGEGWGEGALVTQRTVKKRKSRAPHLAFAKRLRHEQTEAEQKFWRRVRNRGIGGCKFKRQYPMGIYVADFACLERRLIVELDGSQHAERQEHDRIRDEWLASQGFRIVRFWNVEVFTNLERVMERVLRELDVGAAPSPRPSPPTGERG